MRLEWVGPALALGGDACLGPAHVEHPVGLAPLAGAAHGEQAVEEGCELGL